MKSKAVRLLELIESAINTGTDSLIETASRQLSDFVSAEKKAGNDHWKEEPRDRLGRWTSGGLGVGAAYDKDKDTWVDEKGKPLSKAKLRKLEAAGVPKTLVGVKLNPDAKGDLLAVGHFRNARTGSINPKPKYYYSPSHKVRKYRAKFEALKRFQPIKKVLEKASYKDAMDGVMAGAVVFCMDRTAQRIGSGRVKTYTATTGKGLCDLQAKDVKVRGNRVTFKYNGKGGKLYHKTFTDAKLSSVIKSALMAPGGGTKKGADKLFDVTDDTVRTYITDNGGPGAEEVHPHMYRHWMASSLAAAAIRKHAFPVSKRDATRIKRTVCEYVASVLNNTPAVAYETYINPVVWRDWGDLQPKPPKLDQDKKGVAFEHTPTMLDKALEELFEDTVFPTAYDNDAPRSMKDLFPETAPKTNGNSYREAISA